MNIEKERELFEAFISDTWLSDAEWNESCNTYKESSIHMMWTSWLASRNREGYVLVPVIANKKMLKAGYDAHDEFFFDSQVHEVYKAMIGAVDE